ncbi:MAG TPA: methyl-accepting chemotaxis protein [Burkholderiaceae bacterium]|nr:methyl-accepting chemotaxis protein [Burkholderiaceae bacterium]
MRKISLIPRLSVRTSLILALVFFEALLIAGAALGLWSLRTDRAALTQISSDQEASRALGEAVVQYKDIQAALGKALANDAAVHQAAAAKAAGLAATGAHIDKSKTQTYLDAAKQALNTSRDNFASYEKMVKGHGNPAYAKVKTTYEALMGKGVGPLFDFASKGDITGYAGYLSSTTQGLEDDFSQALGFARATQWRTTNTIKTGQATNYQRITILVAAAAGVSILFAILTYFMLGRVVLRPLRTVQSHFARIASGDLTQRVEVKTHNEIGVLFEALRNMQESLTSTVSAVRQGVEEITTGSREIFVGNTDLSSRTEQQAASLQQTAASMEELASTVKQNTDNAMQADELAKKASDVAQRGGDAVGQAVGSMDAISTSAGKISEIVSVIDGIAFQTNILALNAAVEAARAGEQGKGFAVVAGEVRSLAQRSAQAAKEVKGLIEESLSRVQAGSAQVRQAGDIMRDVVEAVSGVTAIMNEIASASREQSEGIDQVNQAVTQMDEVTQQNAALVEQAAAASGSLQEQAARLHKAVAVFILEREKKEGAEAPVISPARPLQEAHSPAPTPPVPNGAAPHIQLRYG